MTSDKSTDQSSSGIGDDNPTELISAAFGAAQAAFQTDATGDPKVMAAFVLGWQMAEVYRPDSQSATTPAVEDDLPGISRLTAAERQEMGLLQVQAGITKLSPAIRDSGLAVPNAEDFADVVTEIVSPVARAGAIREFHVNLLATLTAADFRLGKAYGLGRALADTTRQPPDWQAELATHRVATVAGWIRELASALPPHAGQPVAQSMEAWSRWAPAQPEDSGKTRRQLSAQGRLWRSLLSGEKKAIDVLETSDYLRAGEGMLQRNGALMRKFLGRYWWLVLTAFMLFGGGVWLIVGTKVGVTTGLGGATVFTSLGLSWKGIGTSLGRAGAHAEEPLWQAELDQAVYERITPDDIVKRQHQHRPGPDEPSIAIAD